uniref:PCI domain-containing protein n=1 Tax=Euplotes harpa TaxID=151035 RepID=A0A7S3NEY4_9SPIT|mmetsp:Transcript_5089/g.6018  ORF Transcript_5089/g.6018 Transcript_5089/m.6018 type:complete len:135 (+) Transcript_5089:426-830(+)
MKFEIGTLLSDLTSKQKKNEAIQHSLKMRKAYSADNYEAFFKLYKKAPNMTPYLVDIFIEKIRLKALKMISKSYTAGLELSYIHKVLAFDSKSDLIEFINKFGGKLSEDCKWLNCRDSYAGFVTAVAKIKKKPE